MSPASYTAVAASDEPSTLAVAMMSPVPYSAEMVGAAMSEAFCPPASLPLTVSLRPGMRSAIDALALMSPPPLTSASMSTPWVLVVALSVLVTDEAESRLKVALRPVPPLRSDLVLISSLEAVE